MLTVEQEETLLQLKELCYEVEGLFVKHNLAELVALLSDSAASRYLNSLSAFIRLSQHVPHVIEDLKIVKESLKE